MVELTDAQVAWIAPLVAPVLSLITAFVTKEIANPRAKALVLQFLASVTALAAVLAANDWTFVVKDAIVTLLVTYATSEVVYEYVWKRYGLSQIIAAIAPNFGLLKGPLTTKFAPPLAISEDDPLVWVNGGTKVAGTSSTGTGTNVIVAVPPTSGDGGGGGHTDSDFEDAVAAVEGAPDEDWTDPPTGTPGVS